MPLGRRTSRWDRGRAAVPKAARCRLGRRLLEPCVELLQGHAAAPCREILEQNLQFFVQALDIRGAAETGTAAGHKLRGMQRELDMRHSLGPGPAYLP